MKNFLPLFILTALMPAQAFAFNILPSNPADYDWNSLVEVINNIANILLWLVAAIAIIYILIGGYKYIFSFGNPEAIEHAKNTLVYAIIGLILALSAILIMNFIYDQTGRYKPEIDIPSSSSNGENGGEPADGEGSGAEEGEEEEAAEEETDLGSPPASGGGGDVGEGQIPHVE